jgi:cytochrome c biogenesis protein CcmG/thiol:disulfide interchange protein DsbE
MPVSTRKKRIALLLLGLASFVWIAHSAYVKLAAQATELAAPGPLAQGMSLDQATSFETTDGKKIALADLKGKALILNFWAGWCAPCLHEMPSLYDLQKRLGPKGLAVVAVNMDDDPASGLRALKKTAGEPPFPVYKGMGSALADRFAIEGLPYTVLVDRNAKIVYARAGELPWEEAAVKKMVEGLL